jgi:hypothetical protein
MDAQGIDQVPGEATRFRKGESPNPGGRPGGKMFNALVNQLVAELGGDLPPSKMLLVEQLARLKLTLGRKSDDVRAANTMVKLARILGLVENAKQPGKPSLTDYVRDKYGTPSP